ALHFHRWFEERHFNKLAMAGLISTHPLPVGQAPIAQRNIAIEKLSALKPVARTAFDIFIVLLEYVWELILKTSSFVGSLVRRKRPTIPFVPTFSAFE